MSTAFYPTNMRRMPASGYNHQSTIQNIPYIPWKGSGVESNPTGIASGNIRPLTNNDSGNVFPTGFGLPRPLKHYRKGVVIPVPPIPNPDSNREIDLINSNLNRHVKSSYGTSLGGGAGGRGLITQVITSPGSFITKQNPLNEVSQTEQMNKDCLTCQGVGLVVDYYPNKTYLTDNPEKNTTNPPLCCNPERKAIRRVLPASTLLKKNYYTTTYQYLQNRCQTYDQRVFNFKNSVDPVTNNPPNELAVTGLGSNVKPGSPLALYNTYVANCQPDAEIAVAGETALIANMVLLMVSKGVLTTEEAQQIKDDNINTFQKFTEYISTLEEPQKTEVIAIYDAFVTDPYTGVPITGPTNAYGCKLVVYKPNNYQYATQGAVTSSTRILKLNVDTIGTNAASFRRLGKANQINPGSVPIVPFLYKFKVEKCKPQNLIHFQNHKMCLPGQASPTQRPFASNANRLGPEVLTHHR